MRPRTLYVVAATATIALLIALAVDLLVSGYHRTGANGRVRAAAVNMPPGARLCQPGQPIEAGTGRVRFYARGVGPVTGPLALSIESGGKVVGQGRVSAHRVGVEEQLTGSIGRLPKRLPTATVCITNRGPAMQILGEPTPYGTNAARLPAGEQPAQFVLVNLDFQGADKDSWLSFAPTVAHRYGLAKATFFGTWTFWLAMVALLGLAVGAIWLTASTVTR